MLAKGFLPVRVIKMEGEKEEGPGPTRTAKAGCIHYNFYPI